jgi:hypothetical protein
LRQLAAILLGGLFLFNWVGYRILQEYLQDRATRRLQARLDKAEYQPDQLLHIKIPTTHLSYFNQSDEFEHIEGRIDVDGVPYQFVGRRILNDSAEYLCIPNIAVQRLKTNSNIYFSLVNDLQTPRQHPKGSHDGDGGQNYLGDPYLLPECHSFGPSCSVRVTTIARYAHMVAAGVRSLIERPPMVCA